MRLPLLIVAASLALGWASWRAAHACSYAPSFVEVEVPDADPDATALPAPTIAALQVRRGADEEYRDGCNQVSTSCSDGGSVRFTLLDKSGQPFRGAVAYRVSITGTGAEDFWWPQNRPTMPVADESEFVLRFWDRDQDLDVMVAVTPIGADGQTGEPAAVAISDSLGGCRVARRSGGLPFAYGFALAGLVLLWRRRRPRR